MPDTVLVGVGGHAAVVLEAAIAAGVDVAWIVDDDPSLEGSSVLGVDVLGSVPEPDERASRYLHGIGNNQARCDVAGRLGGVWVTVVHPGAVVAPSAMIADGVAVMAKSVVQARSVVESGAIINTGAVVEHDCVVGAFSHVAPNATVTGGVSIGLRALVGAGSVVLPGLEIGSDAIVGAGAVVIDDVPGGATVVGNPARIVQNP